MPLQQSKNPVFKFLRATWSELRYKVSWPSYKEIEKFLLYFVVGMVVFALLVTGLNALNRILQYSVYRWIIGMD